MYIITPKTDYFGEKISRIPSECPGQDRHSVCLQRLSEDDTGRQRVKWNIGYLVLKV